VTASDLHNSVDYSRPRHNLLRQRLHRSDFEPGLGSLRGEMVNEAPADPAAAAVSNPIPELPPTTRKRRSFDVFMPLCFFLFAMLVARYSGFAFICGS
jgi:hypothetical protein